MICDTVLRPAVVWCPRLRSASAVQGVSFGRRQQLLSERPEVERLEGSPLLLRGRRLLLLLQGNALLLADALQLQLDLFVLQQQMLEALVQTLGFRSAVRRPPRLTSPCFL